ncbi:MAG: molybdopterin-guanine dinucleotide biosynthesis protein B [Desulfatiglandaceae bacterium]
MTLPPLIAFVGYSNSGKTTFIESLIPEFISMNLRVGTLKHAGHRFEPDIPGKDSWRHRRAGASVTVTASAAVIAMTMETDSEPRPQELMHLFKGLDLVIAEGFKHEPVPKIFVSGRGNKFLDRGSFDEHVIAVVSDMPLKIDLPVFSTADAAGVAGFVLKSLHLRADEHTGFNSPGGVLR